MRCARERSRVYIVALRSYWLSLVSCSVCFFDVKRVIISIGSKIFSRFKDVFGFIFIKMVGSMAVVSSALRLFNNSCFLFSFFRIKLWIESAWA